MFKADDLDDLEDLCDRLDDGIVEKGGSIIKSGSKQPQGAAGEEGDVIDSGEIERGDGSGRREDAYTRQRARDAEVQEILEAERRIPSKQVSVSWSALVQSNQ